MTPSCVWCGGTEDLKDRGMAPGMTYCAPCRKAMTGSAEQDAPTPEAAAREAVWGYLRDYPDCSITWTESAYIAQLAVEAWKAAS